MKNKNFFMLIILFLIVFILLHIKSSIRFKIVSKNESPSDFSYTESSSSIEIKDILISKSNDFKLLFNKTNEYGTSIVYDLYGYRCLTFDKILFKKDKIEHCSQSIMEINATNKLIFSYIKQFVALAVLMNKEPKKVLIIGVGGGSVAKAFSYMYPDVKLDLVDINENIIDIVQNYFYLKPNENIKIYNEDGVSFVKNSAKTKYDIIILDAFNKDYIPVKMLTTKFLVDIKSILKPRGFLLANLFKDTKYTALENGIFNKVFEIVSFYPAKGNRVAFASRSVSFKLSEYAKNSVLFETKLQNIEISRSYLTETLNLIYRNIKYKSNNNTQS